MSKNTKQLEAEVKIETPETEEADMAMPESEAETAESVDMEALEAAKREAEDKLQKLSDVCVRLQADFDNFRRRTRENESRMADQFTASTVENFLPVLDSFELAMQHMRNDKKGEAYVQGFELLQKQLLKVITDIGVTEIEAEGKPFDPRFHEAVMQVQSDDGEDDSVGMVLQKGYMYKDTVLRPAKVQVIHH